MKQLDIIPIPGFSEPVACWSHLFAAAGFCVFLAFLLHKAWGNSLRLSALLIYGVCAIYLFSMSGVYHLLEPGGGPRSVLQRLDHSGIWAMIAGTFTPIHIILFRAWWRWGALAFIWLVSITGLTLEVVFFTDFPEWLSLLLYLALGWFGLATFYRYIQDHEEKIARYLVFGGISYSLGGIFEFCRWPILIAGVIGPHEVFHFFVMGGAAFHGFFIFKIAALGLKKNLTFAVKNRGEMGYYVVAQGEKIKFAAPNLQEAKLGISQRKIGRAHV